MGTITRAYDFVASTTAVADQVDADLNTIYTEVNGSLDAANLADGAVTTSKLGASAVTSAKVGAGAILHAGLDFTQANSGVKVPKMGGYYAANGANLLICKTAYTVPVATQITVTVTFATDTLTGATTFTAAPVPLGLVVYDGTGAVAEWPGKIIVSAITTTTATIKIDHAAATGGGGNQLYTTWLGAA